MADVHLLDKTRRLLRLLHLSTSGKVIFSDICQVLCGILDSKVFIISRKGKVLGTCDKDFLPVLDLLEDKVGSFVDEDFLERLLNVLSTKENVLLSSLGFTDKKLQTCRGIITPIVIGGKRFGSLFMYKASGEYDIDDIILAEYGATVVGLELLRSVNEEKDESQRRKLQAKNALECLSITEKKSVCCVLSKLDGFEGMLNASLIAKEHGITRSVIVNALRKLESSGAIVTRSAGVKGTYVKVVNKSLLDLI